MGTFLAVRLLTVTGTHSHQGAAILAAAAAEGDSTIRIAIVGGVFSVLVALISAASLMFRNRGPDVGELLELHERVAVVEVNLADMRADHRTDMAAIRKALDRLERRGDR